MSTIAYLESLILFRKKVILIIQFDSYIYIMIIEKIVIFYLGK